MKDQQNEAEVTDIVALSSHKTHSTPVDPIELKKRLVDLLIQRTTKGDQQALKLKVEPTVLNRSTRTSTKVGNILC